MNPATGHPQRILAAQLARFGDFLQTTPLLSALKARYPGAELTLLVSKGQEALAGGNPDVDRVLVVDLSGLRKAVNRSDLDLGGRILELRRQLDFLRNQDYDLVLNLNTSRPAALLCDLPRSRERMGPRLAVNRTDLDTAPWTDFIMKLMTRRRLIRFNLVDLLTGYVPGEERLVKGLTYPLSDEDRATGSELLGPDRDGPFIGFQLGSRHPSRRWPPEYFAELARRLVEKDGARIVFLGTEAEKPIGRAVREHLESLDTRAGERVIDLMGRTSIASLGGVLSRLDLLVTTDTGTMHLAAAIRTPVLALFIGPAFCHETGPYGEGHLILQTEVDCSPCTEGRHPCLDGAGEDFFCRRLIDPETVQAAAEWRMGRPGGVPFERQPLPPGVRALVSRFDRFGVVYEPLTPRPLERSDVLAIAYRETGRSVITPGYRIDLGALIKTFQAYSRPEGPAREALALELARLATLLDAPERKPRGDDPDLMPFQRIRAGLFKQGKESVAERIRMDMKTVVDRAAVYLAAGFDD